MNESVAPFVAICRRVWLTTDANAVEDDRYE
jgi:hypothetical protein